jgi:hypothetical protein
MIPQAAIDRGVSAEMGSAPERQDEVEGYATGAAAQS